ncbi:MAG TPA: SdpI family protein [archaeon]|jgi:uncharacterized membrane protein|nr:SdpI family protein [archaeon]
MKKTITRKEKTKTSKASTKNKIIKTNSSKNKLNYNILYSISLIIISFALSLLFFNNLPNLMATHWGLEGIADGFTPKEIGVLIIPILNTAILLLLYYLPSIDPLKANIDSFKKEYHLTILTFTIFLTYLHIITLILNLGFNLDIRQLIAPGFALIFYSIGILMKKAKRNFFIGIRTPWTLNSDFVWEKTHNKASKLFKASAILALIGFIAPNISFFFMLVPIIISSITITIYSYIEYKKETN